MCGVFDRKGLNHKDTKDLVGFNHKGHREHQEHEGIYGFEDRVRNKGGMYNQVTKAQSDREGEMKSRLLAGWVRVLLAAVVLAVAIGTFNFGLSEGLFPTQYLWLQSRWCEFADCRIPTQPMGTYAPGELLVTLLLLAGAFILFICLWRIVGRETERRRRKNYEAYLSRSWAISDLNWTHKAPVRQLNLSRTRIRSYKKTRL